MVFPVFQYSSCLNASVKSTKPTKQPKDLSLERKENSFSVLLKTKRLTNVRQKTFKILNRYKTENVLAP